MVDVIDKYDSVFREAGAEWDVDPLMLKAIAKHESGGDPNSRGKSGEVGLGQFMPDTAKRIGITNRSDPEQSIWGMAKLMNEALIAEKENPTAALRYYNGGAGWRTSRTDPKYPSYVGGQYKKYAKADTGSMTDATPAGPEETAPKDDLLERMRKLSGVDSRPGAPAPEEPPPKDDLRERMRTLAPSDKPAAPPPQQGPEGYDRGMVPGPPVKTESHAPNLLGAYQPNVRERVGDWIGDTATSIGRALGSGYRDAPGVLTPEAQAAVEGVPYVGPVLGTATGAASTALRLAGAGFKGAQAGVAAGGDVVSPGLGRELAAGMEVAPFYPGGITGPFRALPGEIRSRIAGRNQLQPPGPRETFGPPPPPDTPAYVPPGTPPAPAPPPGPAPSMIPPRTTTDPVTGVTRPIVTPETGALPGPGAGVATTEPIPGMPGGGQRSAGAMGTPLSEMPAQTRGQFLNGLQKAVQQTAEERAGPGLKDDNAYVENIPGRMLAQRDFSDSQHALDHKIAVAKDTAYRNEVEANKRDRHQGMVDQLRDDAGDENALEKAHEHRSEVSPQELGVFVNEKPVDISGFAATVKEHLGTKRDAVRSVLQKVYDSLYDADGNLETRPSILYDARKNITDYLQKGVKGVGEHADNIRTTKAILESFLDPLDKKIGEGAPRYRQDYMKEWAARSRVIDRMEFLQQYHVGGKKITDKDGYLIPSKVQKMVEDIYQGNKAAGPNKAKSLAPAEIFLVTAVRNELATEQLMARRGAVSGSDTFQQIENAPRFGEGATGTTAKAVAGSLLHAGTLGTATKMAEIVVKPAMEARRQRAIAAKIAARKAELLSTGPKADAAENLLLPPP